MTEEIKATDTPDNEAVVTEEENSTLTDEGKAQENEDTGTDGVLTDGDKPTDEDGQKKTDAEGGEESKTKDIPEKYEVKVPEGMELDEKAMDLFTPVFKELGISQEGAQKLVDVYGPYVASQVEAQKEQSLKDFQSITNEWKAETEKFLGPEKGKQLAYVAKAINTWGSDELRTLLSETGVGNNKELVNFMIKAGKTIAEDPLDDTAPIGGGVPDASLRNLYPTMKK